MSIPTPHISALKSDMADIVLMPGDPLRAKYIADKFLENCKLVSSVRNMLMYTGYFNGRKVTVAGSGMGIPSIGIYSYELFNFYDVKTIIRIGSSGSYSADINVRDLVLVTEAVTDGTGFSYMATGEKNTLSYPDPGVNEVIKDTAKELNMKLISGRVHSTDVFYSSFSFEEIIKMMGQPIAVEMESFALFTNAKKANKRAACLLTISDNLIKHEYMSSDERQKTLDSMIKLSLTAATKL